ncbi:MAG: MDR family MFS transporter [Gaiellaceae bacterium]
MAERADGVGVHPRATRVGGSNGRHHALTWGGPVQQTNRIARDYRWWALGAVLLVNFTSALSSTIIGTAVPTIVGELHGFQLYGWVFTGYMLAATVTVPIFGKLSDHYGRRPFYLWGIALFVAGSVLSGFAQSMIWLIGARVVAGLGGGAMMALSAATIGDIFSPRERGRWMGVLMGVFGLASIVGPTAGGVITDHLGWRWVFFVTIPLALFAWMIVGIILPRFRSAQVFRLDLSGIGLLVSGLVAILLGFTWGGATYAWSSWQELICFCLGSALLVGFVLNELLVPEALLPPRLFRNRIFTLSILISFLITFGMYGGLTFIPLFVQGVIGDSAQDSGIVLTPMMLSFVVGAAIGGQLISRTGRYRLQGIVGMAMAVAGLLLFSRLTPSSDSGEVVRDMIVLGVGIGATMPIYGVTIQSAFPHSMLGLVNSARQLFANLGGAIAVPLMTAVMVNTFSHDLPRYAPAALHSQLTGVKLSPQSMLTKESQAAVAHHFRSLPNGQALFRQYVRALRHALSNGIVELFLVGAAFTGVAFLLTLVFPHIELTSWDEDPAAASDGFDMPVREEEPASRGFE